jgi:hypothetical protein
MIIVCLGTGMCIEPGIVRVFGRATCESHLSSLGKNGIGTVIISLFTADKTGLPFRVLANALKSSCSCLLPIYVGLSEIVIKHELCMVNLVIHISDKLRICSSFLVVLKSPPCPSSLSIPTFASA